MTTTGFEWASNLNAEPSPGRWCWVPDCDSHRSGMQHLWEAHREIYDVIRVAPFPSRPEGRA